VKQKITQRAPPSDSEVDSDRASSAAALLALGKPKAPLPSPAAEAYKAKLERDVQKALDQAYREHEEAMDALVRERDQLRYERESYQSRHHLQLLLILLTTSPCSKDISKPVQYQSPLLLLQRHLQYLIHRVRITQFLPLPRHNIGIGP
jgi:hypothetical protein